MSLADFRVDATPAPPMPKAGPDLSFYAGEVLAIDQSITATGWVHLCYTPQVGLHCQAKGSILLPPAGYPKGYEGMLLRADALSAELDDLMRRLPVIDVVHETPALSVGKMARPEASLMAAVAVRAVARQHGHPVTMIQNQHSKKVLVGRGNAEKKDWHKVLERITWTGERPTNEGQRDAMCLGLTHLIEKGDE